MNELIKIKTDENGKRAVNARDLHEFLESKRDFSHWIKDRIRKYGFIEDVDFTLVKIVERGKSGAQTKIEYALTLNMAKELSMVEGNAKGKQARRYFIECEERVKRLPPPEKHDFKRNALVELAKSCPSMNITLTVGEVIEAINYCVLTTRKELEQQIMDANAETYPSVAKVAEILDVNKSTLWRWAKRGYLIPVEIGSKRRYRMSDVRKILNGGQ